MNHMKTTKFEELIIKNLLIEQIYSKVRWRESILYMLKNDVREFIEIGPGKVLSGMAKRTNHRDISDIS